MVYLCRHCGLIEVADFWQGVICLNDYQKERFVLKMIGAMFNTLADKTICFFGFAFNSNTGDTRESPAIEVARRLAEERANIVVTDPAALDNARLDLEDLGRKVSNVEDPYEAASNSDAVAVMTEWNLYKDLNYRNIYQSMRLLAFVFDGRNILDHKALFEIGFNVYPIGKPALTHFNWSEGTSAKKKASRNSNRTIVAGCAGYIVCHPLDSNQPTSSWWFFNSSLI